MTGDRPARIGMFVHSHDDRAVSRHVVATCAALADLGAEPVLLRVAASAAAMPAPEGVPVVSVGHGSARTGSTVLTLARTLRSLHLDVVFAHLNGPGRAALLARALGHLDVAVVPVEHVHYGTFYRHRHPLQDPLTRLLYPHADAVAGVSTGVVQELERVAPRITGHTVVLPAAGPDAERLALASQVVAHPWFSGRTRPRLVCSVANLLPRKGQHLLVQALPAVRARSGDVRLVLVGRPDDAAYAAELARLIDDLQLAPYVWLTGYQAEPLPYIAQSDVFALASETEGCPTVLIEAMTCGTPVVATDCPVGPRYLLADGRFGQLVPVGDPASLGDAIVAALTDDKWRVEVAEEGRRHAEEFTPRAVATRYLDVAEQVRHRRAG